MWPGRSGNDRVGTSLCPERGGECREVVEVGVAGTERVHEHHRLVGSKALGLEQRGRGAVQQLVGKPPGALIVWHREQIEQVGEPPLLARASVRAPFGHRLLAERLIRFALHGHRHD
jgi:hypothetical protein